MTPDAPDWETYRAWKLLAHIGANKAGTPMTTLAEEVRATRQVRENIGRDENNPMTEQAKEAAEILHKNDLYATALDSSNRLQGKTVSEHLLGLLGLLLILPRYQLHSLHQEYSGGLQNLWPKVAMRDWTRARLTSCLQECFHRYFSGPLRHYWAPIYTQVYRCN